jgi:hypothetical protein
MKIEGRVITFDESEYEMVEHMVYHLEDKPSWFVESKEGYAKVIGLIRQFEAVEKL